MALITCQDKAHHRDVWMGYPPGRAWAGLPQRLSLEALRRLLGRRPRPHRGGPALLVVLGGPGGEGRPDGPGVPDRDGPGPDRLAVWLPLRRDPRRHPDVHREQGLEPG